MTAHFDRWPWALLSGALFIAGCSGVRVDTYPPDFTYLPRDEIRDTMTRMSVEIWRINDILDRNETVASYQREEIIEALRALERSSEKLGAGWRLTNHALIDENIDGFRDSVVDARLAVEREPANYYLAGKLSGSCLACHKLAREAR